MSWADIRKLYIEEETEECYLKAVGQNPVAIRLIENPSEEVCLIAVRYSGKYIKYIKDPSEEVCLCSIRNAFCAGFDYIKNPSERVCLEVISRHPEMIRRMKNPTPRMYMNALGKLPELVDILDVPDEILSRLLDTNPEFIKRMKNPSIEDYFKVVSIVVNSNRLVWKDNLLCFLNKFMVTLSEEESLRFIQIKPHLIKIIERPTIKQVYRALKVEPSLLEYIDIVTQAEPVESAEIPEGDGEI